MCSIAFVASRASEILVYFSLVAKSRLRYSWEGESRWNFPKFHNLSDITERESSRV